jgi:hypothetical protein
MKRWILTTAAVLAIQLGAVRAEDNVLTPAEVAEGFRLMFDGTLASFKADWVDYIKGNTTNTTLDAKWVVDANLKAISLPSGSTNQDIRSTKMYKDFELRLNYRIDGNQGIYYRALQNTDRAWQTGIEYAINNVTNLGKDNPGAAYDIYAPPTPVPYYLFNTAKWNSARIVVKGDSVEHWANGIKVVGFKYHSTAFWVAYNQSKWHPDDVLTNKVPKTQDVGSGYIEEGYLGFQGDHGGRWQIKDLKLTTKPCFGPIKDDGSVCAGTTAILNGSKARTVNFAAIRGGSGNLTITFADEIVKRASIIGLDGKAMGRASLSEGGRKAEFTEALKTGLYFLRLELASGSVTQKLNLL